MATLHKKEMAHKLGKGLLNKRLIVCYNLSSVESAYWWKGELLEENETMIIMKTTEDKFNSIVDYFLEHSGYEVPELIALQPSQVNKSYINWVEKEVADG